MKFTKRILALLLAALMLLSLVACAAKTPAADAPATDAPAADTPASDEPITLTLWTCNNMVKAPEINLPQEEWYISGAIERFCDLHPNVTIEVASYSDNAQVSNDFKAATVAQSGPDIVCFMNGLGLLSLKDGLLPLDDYITDDLRNNVVGWDTCAEGLNAENTIYGMPYAGQSVACFAYNKALVKQAGLDFENDTPRTVDEFYAAMDTMKEAGILPFHVDESYPMLLLYGLGMWWEEKSGLDGILAHDTEGTSFADDEGFVYMMTEYQKFYENGWVNEDTATSADLYNAFLQGECAMYPIFFSDVYTFEEVLGDDLGVLPVPTTREDMVDIKTAVGGVGAALGVSNFCENPDMAVEFVKFLLSRDEMIRYYTVAPEVPIRTDITAEDIGAADDKFLAIATEMSAGISYWPDNNLNADVANVYYSMPGQVLVGNMSVDELTQMMDEASLD